MNGAGGNGMFLATFLILVLNESFANGLVEFYKYPGYAPINKMLQISNGSQTDENLSAVKITMEVFQIMDRVVSRPLDNPQKPIWKPDEQGGFRDIWKIAACICDQRNEIYREAVVNMTADEDYKSRSVGILFAMLIVKLLAIQHALQFSMLNIKPYLLHQDAEHIRNMTLVSIYLIRFAEEIEIDWIMNVLRDTLQNSEAFAEHLDLVMFHLTQMQRNFVTLDAWLSEGKNFIELLQDRVSSNPTYEGKIEIEARTNAGQIEYPRHMAALAGLIEFFARMLFKNRIYEGEAKSIFLTENVGDDEPSVEFRIRGCLEILPLPPLSETLSWLQHVLPYMINCMPSPDILSWEPVPTEYLTVDNLYAESSTREFGMTPREWFFQMREAAYKELFENVDSLVEMMKDPDLHTPIRILRHIEETLARKFGFYGNATWEHVQYINEGTRTGLRARVGNCNGYWGFIMDN